MEELKPCPNPWCATTSTRMVKCRRIGIDESLQWVRCSCGVCGPIKRSRVEAVVAWNERPAQQNAKLVQALKDCYAMAIAFAGQYYVTQGLPDVHPQHKKQIDRATQALREAGAIQ